MNNNPDQSFLQEEVGDSWKLARDSQGSDSSGRCTDLVQGLEGAG